MAEAITAGGGHLVAPEAAEGLVWGSPVDADGLAAALRRAPGVRWVQLPWAGVERFVQLMDDDRLWTCGKGVYAEPVAEMVITLALAGMRGLGTYARARSWQKPQGTNLLGARVTRPSRFVSLWAPLSLVAGIALVSYGVHLLHRYGPRRSTTTPTAPCIAR